MKHGQAAAVRLSWLLPYVIVQTGMVVAHAAAFVAGAAGDARADPQDAQGRPRRVSPRRARARARRGPGGAGAGEASASASDENPTVVSVGGSTSEPTTPTKRPGGNAAGHPFEARSRDRGGGAIKTTRLASIPGTPQRPTNGAETAPSEDVEGVTRGDGDARRIAGAAAAAGGPERSPGSARRRLSTFAAEAAVAAAMFWLSFAVAAADGWREPAFACAFIALCVLYVACHNWDDTWRLGLRRGPRARDSYPEALLGGVSSDTYGGLDAHAAGAARGGRVRPRAAQRRVGRSGGFLRLERAEVRAPERPADARGDSAVQAVPREGFRPGHHQRAVRGFRRVQRRRERVRRAGRRAGGARGAGWGRSSEATPRRGTRKPSGASCPRRSSPTRRPCC